MPAYDESLLPEWFETNAGKALMQDEINALAALIPEQFYPAAMQFGAVNNPVLEPINIGQAYYCDQNASILNQRSQLEHCVVSLPEQLPFSEQSLDLAILPHTLDFCENPHDVLRELSQIMRPEGVMVLTGFNAYSLWSAARLFMKHKPPFNARFLSRPRVQDWLSLLGFVNIRGAMLNYQPPNLNEKFRLKLEFMNNMGDRWWPMCGAVYMIVVQKKQHGGVFFKQPAPYKKWFALQPSQAKTAVFANHNKN